MPLSELQSEILTLLAAHRNPESYVAGASALNQNSPRFSAGRRRGLWPSSPDIAAAMMERYRTPQP